MKALIEEFYQAFDQLNAEAMVACYHPEVCFEDPAFGILKGNRAGNMWRMLCESQKGKEFSVSVFDIEADEQRGKARWEAHYNFSRTGRKVHNIIYAEFRFQEGKIIDHRDRFDLYRWSKQALGTSGLLLGWTPYFRKKLQGQTNHLLDKFESKVGGHQ